MIWDWPYDSIHASAFTFRDIACLYSGRLRYHQGTNPAGVGPPAINLAAMAALRGRQPFREPRTIQLSLYPCEEASSIIELIRLSPNSSGAGGEGEGTSKEDSSTQVLEARGVRFDCTASYADALAVWCDLEFGSGAVLRGGSAGGQHQCVDLLPLATPLRDEPATRPLEASRHYCAQREIRADVRLDWGNGLGEVLLMFNGVES
eukprot:COSAG05_NODE_4132_length_1659_cov_1.733333_1_plen_205_part_00